jgi:hypothetical protein
MEKYLKLKLLIGIHLKLGILRITKLMLRVGYVRILIYHKNYNLSHSNNV